MKVTYFFLVTARAELPAVEPSAPAQNEGFCEAQPPPRGILRAHSVSPFVRSVRQRISSDETGDMAEAVSCLLDFSKRRGLVTPPPTRPSEQSQMVWTFMTSTPKTTPFTFITSTPKTTPVSTPRQPSPPRIQSRRILPRDIPRPLAMRRPPSAALGAPALQEDEDELMDIPDTPRSPAVSDITILRLVLLFFYYVIFFIIFLCKCISYINFFLF